MTGCSTSVKRCRSIGPPLDMHRLFGEPKAGADRGDGDRSAVPDTAQQVVDPLGGTRTTCSCCRRRAAVRRRALSPGDAAAIGVEDNDWIECTNANGVFVGRAIVSHRIPDGVTYVHHAQERTIDVPKSEATGRRGGIHNP